MEGSEMPTRRYNGDHLREAPLALHPATLARIVEWGRTGALADPAAILALQGPHDAPPRSGSVAVIPVYGVIEHHADWMMELFGDGVSIDGLREALRAALADPEVKAVVLDIDSPGGGVAGVTELANEIRSVRGGDKPIVAVANAWAGSAAYWLASQADELVMSPSGQVGSIGVYAVHQDVSRMLDEMGVTTTVVSAGPHKTEGNMFEPLTDEARDELQSKVDATYAQFVADVAAGRRVSTDQVEADFGGGRMLVAKAALVAGMVDRIETLGETIQRLGRAGGRRRALMAVAGGPEIEATADESPDDPPDQPPFTERLVAFAGEADAVVVAAGHRARSRAAAGRPLFSTQQESALRASRDAIDALLAGEPGEIAVEPPGEPAPSTPPAAAPIPMRFRSRTDWLRFLEATASR